MTAPRVLIYCPTNPVTPEIYGRSLQSVFRMEWNAPHDVVFGRHRHPLTDRAGGYQEITDKYNHARELALAGGYDALFTVEADMILPPLALERLTRVQADVAYGLYCSRHGTHQWLAYSHVGDRAGNSIGEDVEYCRDAWGTVVETQGVGMGCTLIWRHVLEDVEFRIEPGGAANDWYFSLDLMARGYKQAHDLGVVCGHIASNPARVLWPDPDADALYSVEYIDPPRVAQPGESVTVELARFATAAVHAARVSE